MEQLNMIDELIKNNPYLYGLLNLLIGGLAGLKLSLSRDKRKEFNEIAFPIRQELENQLELIKEKENSFGGKSRGIPKAISQERFIGLELKIGNFKKSQFKDAVRNYQACFVTHRHPDHNGNYYDVVKNDDYENLDTCIKKLIKLCELK
jgi:hypothetical protein